MIRRALEWVGGSVLVYVLVAACAGVGGPGGKDDEDLSGGDGDSTSGDGDQVAGDGDSAPRDDSPGDGDTTPGDGDLIGDGDLLDPVPDADAAEDGQRIVNIYRTTDGGLKTHEGYWDTQLSVKCSFQKQADGKTYCVPASEAYSIYTFSDPGCSQPVVAVPCGSAVPTSVVGVYNFSLVCDSGGSYQPHEVGSKLALASFYLKTSEGGACTEQTAVEGTSYYSVGAKISLTNLVEGFTSHGS